MAHNSTEEGWTCGPGPLRGSLHPLVPLVQCTEAAITGPSSAVIVAEAGHRCCLLSLNWIFWCHTVMIPLALGIYGTRVAGRVCVESLMVVLSGGGGSKGDSDRESVCVELCES